VALSLCSELRDDSVCDWAGRFGVSVALGTSTSAASAVADGKTVLVLGKVDSTTITASQVIVDLAINLSKKSVNVSAFKSPNESESKSVWQIPVSYKRGSGDVADSGDLQRVG
jgi:hypothetical protein